MEGPNRGRGVASGYWMNGAGPAYATANVKADGTVSLLGRRTLLQVADPPVGILLFLALSSIGVYGVMLAG